MSRALAIYGAERKKKRKEKSKREKNINSALKLN